MLRRRVSPNAKPIAWVSFETRCLGDWQCTQTGFRTLHVSSCSSDEYDLPWINDDHASVAAQLIALSERGLVDAALSRETRKVKGKRALKKAALQAVVAAIDGSKPPSKLSIDELLSRALNAAPAVDTPKGSTDSTQGESAQAGSQGQEPEHTASAASSHSDSSAPKADEDALAQPAGSPDAGELSHAEGGAPSGSGEASQDDSSLDLAGYLLRRTGRR